MGFHASGDAYTRRVDDITADVEQTRRCVDDALLWDDGIEEAFWHTFDYLKLGGDNGIVYNEKKFVFAEPEVEWAGFELTMDGYRPPKKIIDAIRNFPTPKNITDMRSWFGLVNQVAYAFSRTKEMAPFRDSLSRRNKEWYWDENLDALFSKSKEAIVQAVTDGVRAFEVDHEPSNRLGTRRYPVRVDAEVAVAAKH